MLVRHFGRFQQLVWLAVFATVLPTGAHAASLLHQYTFNGGTANDSVGSANGTIVDPSGTFAKFNAGRLDLSANTGAGPGDPISSTAGAFVQLPNALFTSSVTGGAISLEMWVNVSTNRANARLWSFGSNIPNGASPYWGQFTDWVDLNGQNGTGNLALTTHDGTQGFNVNEAQGPTPSPLSTGSLHQVVTTLDVNDTQSGANPNGTMRLYVDKLLTATQAISPNLLLGNFDDSQNDNFLGRSQWGDALFDGQIDEFSIYGGALTQTDINTNFTTGPAPTPIPTFVIDRATGEVRVENHTSIAFKLKSYSISSAAGGLDVAHWNSITDTGDSNSGGSFDPTGVWSKQSSLATLLAESTTTTGGQLNATTGVRSLGDAWFRTPFQDPQINFLLGDGSTGTADVSYLGSAIARSDLNGDGLISAADWTIFLANSNKSFVGQSLAQAYLGGDLNGDLVNDFRDFRLFQHDFIATNGQGAFAALVGVKTPEPSSLVLAVVGLVGVVCARRFRRVLSLTLCLICASRIFFGGAAMAASPITYAAFGDPGLPADANAGVDDAWTTSVIGTGGSGSGFFSPFTLTPTPWVLFSYPVDGVSGVIQADHTFTGGALSAGQSVRLDFANRAIASGGGSVGVSLTSGSTVVATFKYNGGDPIGVYRYDDAGGTDQSTGEPFAYQTVQPFEFSINSANSYIAAYGLSSWTGTLTAPIDGIRVFNSAAGDGSDLVFNNLAVGATSLVPLTVEVNKSTGDVKVKGNASILANIDYYQVTSTANALDQVHWNSLDQQNLFAVDGDDPGTLAGDSVTEGWDKDPSATAGRLTEYFLRAGGAAITSGSTLSLGKAYNNGVFGAANGDLQFTYGIANGPRMTGVVTYITSATVTGDYNGNGVVDAADYTVWRDHLGETYNLPNRDPLNGSGPISTADFTSWKTQFGSSGSGGASLESNVPEPSTIALALCGMLLVSLRRRDKETARHICPTGLR